MSLSDNDSVFDGEGGNPHDDQADIDFYTLLNVPKEASLDEINRAYKQRCLLFHPDRHMNDENKREATKIFVLLRKAHETLTDPRLRLIYDTLGARGLDMEGWQLLHRESNAENIRKQYEFLVKLQEYEVMLQRIRPTSNFAVNYSIVHFFQQGTEEYQYLPALLGMGLAQSSSCILTSMDRVGLTGKVRFNDKGQGDGSLTFTYKRTLTASSLLENYLTLGAEKISISNKLSFTSPPNSWFAGTVLVLQPTLDYYMHANYLEPSISPAIVLPLQPNLRGVIALNLSLTGLPSLTISFVHTELNMPKFVLNLSISPVSPSLRITYHKRNSQKDLHFEANCLLSLREISPSIIVDSKLTKYSRIGISLLASFPSCELQAVLRVKTRLNNYEFRLLFCEQQEDLARSALYGVVLPGLIFNAGRLLFRNYLSKMKRYLEGDLEDETFIEMRREQAQKTINLMREAADKIAGEEERKKGLVILEAYYGQMQNDMLGSEFYPVAGDRLVDVTVPLQALVNDSQLRIYSGKDQIPGFYDPSPGDPKMLKVVYRFQGKIHSVTVRDDQPLTLPMRAHCTDFDNHSSVHEHEEQIRQSPFLIPV